MIDLFYYDSGKVKAEDISNISRLRGKQVWIDATDMTHEEAQLLGRTFGLHPLSVEDLFNNLTRIKIEEFRKYLFCVFFGISKSSPVELNEIDFVIGRNFIITNHKKEIDSAKELKSNLVKLAELFRRGNEFILHKILDSEVDSFFPVIEDIEEQLMALEKEGTTKSKQDLMDRILKVKEGVICIKKIALQQREKISFLTKTDLKFISKRAVPYFRDIYDHSIIISDSAENAKESIGIILEVYMNKVSNNLNEIMKVLSVIATITIPLTVIPSIYGTNFRFLPGADQANGFWEMIVVMSVMCIVLLYFFRRKGWF